MNKPFQLNAKKGLLKKMDLTQVYLEPDLFLEIVEDTQGELIQVYTRKEWKQLEKAYC